MHFLGAKSNLWKSIIENYFRLIKVLFIYRILEQIFPKIENKEKKIKNQI